MTYGETIPYLPIIDLLKGNFGVTEGDDEAQILQRIEGGAADWDETARATLPYLRYLLNVDPGDSAIASMDPLGRRGGVFDALRALVHQESLRRPLIVVVEDIHWIDEQSEEALGALVDVIASASVLLILTYRPGYSHSLGERAHYNRLALGHLPPEQSRAVAQSVLQGEVLPEALQSLLTSKTEGNPFFIEEVVKSLVESGSLSKENGAYVLGQPTERVSIPDERQ